MTTTLALVALAMPATAGEVADASAALSFWMAWGLAYLAIGVVLMAVATAATLREERAWSSLLSWATDAGASDDGDDPDGERARQRAA